MSRGRRHLPWWLEVPVGTEESQNGNEVDTVIRVHEVGFVGSKYGWLTELNLAAFDDEARTKAIEAAALGLRVTGRVTEIPARDENRSVSKTGPVVCLVLAAGVALAMVLVLLLVVPQLKFLLLVVLPMCGLVAIEAYEERHLTYRQPSEPKRIDTTGKVVGSGVVRQFDLNSFRPPAGYRYIFSSTARETHLTVSRQLRSLSVARSSGRITDSEWLELCLLGYGVRVTVLDALTSVDLSFLGTLRRVGERFAIVNQLRAFVDACDDLRVVSLERGRRREAVPELPPEVEPKPVEPTGILSPIVAHNTWETPQWLAERSGEADAAQFGGG